MKSATDLILIVEGHEYPDSSNKTQFFMLHCVEENSAVCTILSSAGTKVEFPPHSFIKGAMYPIMLKNLLYSGGAKFIGYRQSGNVF